ncbi:hypothetical protein Tco_0601270 [Tanacetum coccineum]
MVPSSPGEHISRSYHFRTEPLSPLSKGSGASGGGRTTPKKEARSSHSFHQKDGSTRIVLDERITEHAHEVGAIGCDSKLPLRESRRVKASDGALAREAYDVALAGEAYDVALAREAYDDPLEELLQALLRGGLPREHSNLRSRIFMEEFPRSFFSPTRWSSTLITFRNASIFYFKSAREVHYILPGLSSKTRALWELSCLLEAARQSLACIRLCLMCPSCLLGAACKSLACIRLCPRGQSCLHALSTSCGPDVCDICTSYVSRQCTSYDGDSVAPCLLRRLAAPDWLLLAS